MRLGPDLTPLRVHRDFRLVFAGSGISAIGSYTIGPTLGNARSGATARLTGAFGSIVWGGVLCLVGTGVLAAALPAFLRYDGREGLKKKIAEDEAWAARHAVPTTV